MLLALDYDETYTRDPIFWDAMIASAIARGHSVICATMRYEHEGDEVKRDLASKVEAIVSLAARQNMVLSTRLDLCQAYGLMTARTGFTQTQWTSRSN